MAKVQKPLPKFVMSMAVSDNVLTLQAMQSFYVQKKSESMLMSSDSLGHLIW